jgi:hypothetical protein
MMWEVATLAFWSSESAMNLWFVFQSYLSVDDSLALDSLTLKTDLLRFNPFQGKSENKSISIQFNDGSL